jgi:hypothetical protein
MASVCFLAGCVALAISGCGSLDPRQEAAPSAAVARERSLQAPAAENEFAGKNRFGIATGTILYNLLVARNHNTARFDSMMDDFKSLGVVWIRTLASWRDMERSEGSYDFSNLDYLVQAARSRGMKLILEPNAPPAWAAYKPESDRLLPPDRGVPPFDVAAYARFTGRLAAHLRHSDAQGTVAAIELGNEPNHVKAWNPPSAAKYTKGLLIPCYSAIKTANSNMVVLIGGIGGIKDANGDYDPYRFVKELYDNGAHGYFDGISYHPYSYPVLASESAAGSGIRKKKELEVGTAWQRMIAVYTDLMVPHGDGEKKIWITEYGMPTNGPRIKNAQQEEARQAEMVRDVYALLNANPRRYPWIAGIGPLCWFSYLDKGNDPTNRKDFMGMVRSDGTHKPACDAYRLMSSTSW